MGNGPLAPTAAVAQIAEAIEARDAAAIREAMRQQPYVVAGGQPSNGQETGGVSNPAHEHYRRRLEAELLRLFATAAQGSPEAPALLRCAQALALGGVSANRGPPSAERSEQHEALLRYAIDASGHGHPGWLALLADEIGVDVAHTDVPVDDAPQSRMPALLYALVHGPDPLAAAEALKAHGVRPDRGHDHALCCDCMATKVSAAPGGPVGRAPARVLVVTE